MEGLGSCGRPSRFRMQRVGARRMNWVQVAWTPHLEDSWREAIVRSLLGLEPFQPEDRTKPSSVRSTEEFRVHKSKIVDNPESSLLDIYLFPVESVLYS